MAIPYNSYYLRLSTSLSDPYWCQNVRAPLEKSEDQTSRALEELSMCTYKRPYRTEQLGRDVARLVFKVPYRLFVNEKNWQEFERSKVNVGLTFYSCTQWLSVPVKFMVAIIALATSPFSQDRAKWLLDRSEAWTSYMDGRASQLEALKEEGAKKAQTRQEFDEYRAWLYHIDPRLCRSMQVTSEAISKNVVLAVIVDREPETVFFVRETGDYKETPKIALTRITELFNDKTAIQSVYGMGLDNPTLVDSNACRFDACVKVKDVPDNIESKKIAGGRYAVFTHKGPYDELGLICNKIFKEWLPRSAFVSTLDPLFCEYVDYLDPTPEEQPIIRIFVPVGDKQIAGTGRTYK